MHMAPKIIAKSFSSTIHTHEYPEKEWERITRCLIWPPCWTCHSPARQAERAHCRIGDSSMRNRTQLAQISLTANCSVKIRVSQTSARTTKKFYFRKSEKANIIYTYMYMYLGITAEISTDKCQQAFHMTDAGDGCQRKHLTNLQKNKNIISNFVKKTYYSVRFGFDKLRLFLPLKQNKIVSFPSLKLNICMYFIHIFYYPNFKKF